MKQITTNSAKETFEFAKNFAKDLRGGEVIGLIGDLGACKTIFTKGLASGLGIKKTITSPTFVLMKIYEVESEKPARDASQNEAGWFKVQNLIHIDAYRIKSAQDLKSIGIEEYFNCSDTVLAIEWADRIKKILPKKTRFIKIEYREDNKRLINF